jgi:hypothetical protein
MAIFVIGTGPPRVGALFAAIMRTQTTFSLSVTSPDSCGVQLGNCWDALGTLHASRTSIYVYKVVWDRLGEPLDLLQRSLLDFQQVLDKGELSVLAT